MTIKNLLLIFAFLLVMFLSCTPKTGEQITETEPPKVEEKHPATEVQEDNNLSPCPKFSDAPNPDQILEEYVLYRDFLKAGDWPGAYEKWQKVYEISPAADGKRNTVFADGIRFYEYFMSQTQDSIEKEGYINKIFEIYDRIDECYSEGGYVNGRKAFDYFYKYPHRSNDEETYSLFKASIDTDGEDAQYFVINPFTSLLVDLYFAEKISLEEAKKYEQIIRKRLAKGLEACKGTECDRWKIIEEYVPARLEAFERVKGFYDCGYYQNKYFAEFEANPENCETIRTVYSRFTFGECDPESEKFAAVREAYNNLCKPKPTNPMSACYELLRNSQYLESIECAEKVIAEMEDQDKKADYTLLIAKIYHAHLKNFSKARQYAREAAKLRENWGEPYLLIGRLYASSGPLCGPGRGWDSQIVVWPAVDKWQKARSIDPEARTEANKWINQYSQYMPEKGDIFQRGLKEGDKFYVGCWIQETTTIRASN